MGNSLIKISPAPKRSSQLVLCTLDPEIAEKYHLDVKVKCNDDKIIYTSYLLINALQSFGKLTSSHPELEFKFLDSVQTPLYLECILSGMLGKDFDVPKDVSTLRSWMDQAENDQNDQNVMVLYKSIDKFSELPFSEDWYQLAMIINQKMSNYCSSRQIASKYLITCKESLCSKDINPPKFKDNPEFWTELIRLVENEKPETAWRHAFRYLDEQTLKDVFTQYSPKIGAASAHYSSLMEDDERQKMFWEVVARSKASIKTIKTITETERMTRSILSAVGAALHTYANANK